MDRTEVVRALQSFGVVPVVRTSTAKSAATAVDWLRAAGFSVFEITLTSPGALHLIRQLSGQQDVLVGAGTVLNAADARACIDAGAAFVVCPGLVPQVPVLCHASDTACVLGALTPSEVIQAGQLQADAVKIFPVANLGGPAYLKALHTLFPDLILMPTGGVAVDEVRLYLDAGAGVVGVGGKLVDEQAIVDGREASISAAARTALAQVCEAQRLARPAGI